MKLTKRGIQDASRLALQSAAAGSGQLVLMQAFGLPENFVGVLSAVLVVQPTVGHTLGKSMDRIVATLVGSAIGLTCLVLLPSGYGTAVALAVCMLAMNFVAGLLPHWRYGAVAAVALALGSEDNTLQTAIDRTVSIGLGAILGTVVTLVVWPERAIKRARGHLRSALAATADRLNSAVDNARSAKQDSTERAARRFHAEMESARDAADGIRIGDKEGVRRRIDKVERLYNSVLLLNRVANETDSATEGNESLDQAVETVRRSGHELTTDLADGKPGMTDQIETITSALETAREASRADRSGPRDHVFRNALVFGLGEVATSLEALVDDSASA